jgi:hypothetical protein
MEDRIRKVNINKMSDEELEALEERIGKKITNITDDAVEQANKILKIYGLRAKMQIVIEQDQ